MAIEPFDAALVRRLHATAHAERWNVSIERFAARLADSVARAFTGRTPASSQVERYLSSLHLEDLGLACACMDGHDGAWEHLVRTLRPVLYRAADAIDQTGGARDLADSLYADLYGAAGADGQRRSLLRYFHGRSSLATWLRAVLAQRHVDRVRERGRADALPEAEMALPEAPPAPDPDRERYLQAMRLAVAAAIGALASRDRLRLACYYAQDLTLAQIGRLLGEHEATVSRHLARTRRIVRRDVEALLVRRGMRPDEVDACFASVVADAGTLDLAEMLGETAVRKEAGANRSP